MPTETAPFLSDLLNADIDAAGVWLTCRDQVRIRVSLLRAEHARGTCIIFPGRTEYIEKYATVMQILQNHGLNVVTVDWRGQGLADRLLADRTVGHIGTFDDYQRDVDAVMEWVAETGLEQPLYLLAHSMGGCIGLRRLINHPTEFAGAIFSGPMWGIYFAPLLEPMVNSITWIGEKLGLGNTYAPSTSSAAYALETSFEDNKLTNDAALWDMMQSHLRAHPELIVGGPSWTWLRQARIEMAELAKLPSPPIPTYCFVGTDEEIVTKSDILSRMKTWDHGMLDMVNKGRHENLMEPRPAVEALIAKALDHLGFDATGPSNRRAI